MSSARAMRTYIETVENFKRRMRKLYDRKDWKKYDLSTD